MFRETKPIIEDIHTKIEGWSRALAIPLPLEEGRYYDYACPIYCLMMFDPVSVYSGDEACGHHYERTAIEEWKKQKEAQKEAKEGKEEKEEKGPCCPVCRKPITSLRSNDALKLEIKGFLTTTKQNLEQDVKTHPNEQTKNQDRQKLASSIHNFLQHGHHAITLKQRYNRFLERLANGQFKEAAKEALAASKQSSQNSSSTCRIL